MNIFFEELAKFSKVQKLKSQENVTEIGMYRLPLNYPIKANRKNMTFLEQVFLFCFPNSEMRCKSPIGEKRWFVCVLTMRFALRA